MKWQTFAGIASVGAAVLGYQLLNPEPVYTRHVPITTKIVFNREIAAIFQRKCFQCHTADNISVPLTTYKDARPWAVAIKEEILERRMPPWGAASGYGHFSNDVGLTSREISLILSWADGGAPSGVLLADEDKPPVFIPPLNNWEQGAPDATIKVAEAVKVTPDAQFRVERLEVATGLKEARWVRALQLNPDDRRAIRYAAIYDARNGRWLGTWTPSSQVSSMPQGSAVQLPAGAKLTLEIGVKGNGEAEATAAGELGLYFAEKAPAQPATTIDVVPAPMNVAAGKIGERFRAETTLKAAMTLISIWPKLEAGGRSVEVTAVRPDTTVEPLVWVNYYRADWPSAYVLKDPVTLPAGTRVIVTAYYDNKTAAPIAAKPSVTITAQPSSRPAGTLAP